MSQKFSGETNCFIFYDVPNGTAPLHSKHHYHRIRGTGLTKPRLLVTYSCNDGSALSGETFEFATEVFLAKFKSTGYLGTLSKAHFSSSGHFSGRLHLLKT